MSLKSQCVEDFYISITALDSSLLKRSFTTSLKVRNFGTLLQSRSSSAQSQLYNLLKWHFSDGNKIRKLVMPRVDGKDGSDHLQSSAGIYNEKVKDS